MIKDKKVLVVSAHAADYVWRSGGTIAKYVANMNVDVIDLGVPVLSMHAPFEIVAKTDVYMAYRAFYEYFNA